MAWSCLTLSSKIKLKNGKEIVVSSFIVMKYNLGEGLNTFGNEEAPFVVELLREAALEKGLKIFSRGIKTESEIRKLLDSNGFPEYAIAATVEKLTDYKYINDQEYIKEYITSKRYGRLRVIEELKGKGILESDVTDFFIENSWIEEENIKYWINKCQNKTPEQKAGFLIRKGFDPELAAVKAGIEENW